MVCMFFIDFDTKYVYDQSYSKKEFLLETFKVRGCYFVETLQDLYFKS